MEKILLFNNTTYASSYLAAPCILWLFFMRTVYKHEKPPAPAFFDFVKDSLGYGRSIKGD